MKDVDVVAGELQQLVHYTKCQLEINCSLATKNNKLGYIQHQGGPQVGSSCQTLTTYLSVLWTLITDLTVSFY